MGRVIGGWCRLCGAVEAVEPCWYCGSRAPGEVTATNPVGSTFPPYLPSATAGRDFSSGWSPLSPRRTRKLFELLAKQCPAGGVVHPNTYVKVPLPAKFASTAPSMTVGGTVTCGGFRPHSAVASVYVSWAGDAEERQRKFRSKWARKQYSSLYPLEYPDRDLTIAAYSTPSDRRDIIAALADNIAHFVAVLADVDEDAFVPRNFAKWQEPWWPGL